VGIEDVQQREEGPGTVLVPDPGLGRGRTIAPEHHPGVIPRVTADPDLPLEIAGTGLNLKRMRRSSSVP
jgi:hypothetical protein